MDLIELIKAIETERYLLRKIDAWAADTEDKELRRRLCRLQVTIEQDLGVLEDQFDEKVRT